MRCSNSQTSPTISCRSGLSSRATSSRRTSPSSTHRGGTASSSPRRAPARRTSSSRPARATAPTLAHEAAVLRVLADATELAGPGAHGRAPRAEAARLVLSTPAGARDWSEHHAAGRFPRDPGADPRPGARGAAPPSAGRRRHAAAGRRPHVGAVASRAAARAAARPERGRAGSRRSPAGEPRRCAAAGRAARRVPDGALVHGDLRWDNCLAVAAAGSRRRTRVLLVDWELAGPGVGGFDVGTVLAEYLRAWVGSIPIVDPARSRPARRPRGHPLARMRPAMQAFWSAYGPASPAPPLRRVVELAAVRLLQTAVERAQGLACASAHVVTLVQLADNMLRTPDDAAATLLGLRAVSRVSRSGRRGARRRDDPRPTRYAWLGAPSRPLPAALDAELDEPERRSYLVACLREELYARSTATAGRCRRAGASRSRRRGPVAGGGDVAAPTAGAEAGSPGGPSSGSRVDEAVVASARLRARSARRLPAAALRPGAAVSVRCRRSSPRCRPGSTRRSATPPTAVPRAACACTGTSTPAAPRSSWRALTARLNARGCRSG